MRKATIEFTIWCATMVALFGIFIPFAVTISAIEKGGVKKLTPDYFEVYQHCE